MNNSITHDRKPHEPLFHLVKNNAMPWWKGLIVRVVAVLAALVVCGILSVVLIGKDPFLVYATMIKGAFLEPFTLFQNVAMLLAFGLAVLPAFNMKFWNMGANGQVTMGCFVAIVIMRDCAGKMPSGVIMLLMIVGSLAASVIWAVLPAIFKARFNTNETLFTLMMNYIAVGIVNHTLFTWTDGRQVTIGMVNLITREGWFPDLFGNRYLLPIIVVAIMTAFMYIYLKYSKHGYELSVVGESENTARYVGINVR
ncbi:MAG: ABC transporter permease, partial [Clostridia bacterium]|nr:ABC transporter permease [Clostridia bacterium]